MQEIYVNDETAVRAAQRLLADKNPHLAVAVLHRITREHVGERLTATADAARELEQAHDALAAQIDRVDSKVGHFTVEAAAEPKQCRALCDSLSDLFAANRKLHDVVRRRARS